MFEHLRFYSSEFPLWRNDCILYQWQDLEGAESAPPPPLGDGLTPSLTVMLANAKFYCKTWYSEYSKRVPPVAF